MQIIVAVVWIVFIGGGIWLLRILLPSASTKTKDDVDSVLDAIEMLYRINADLAIGRVVEQAKASRFDAPTLLSGFAERFGERGRRDIAASLYSRSLLLGGPNHSITPFALNSLAVLYYRDNNYADARPLFEEALMLSEKHHGPTHPDTIQVARNLADVCGHQRNYDRAEALYKRVLAFYEGVHGGEHNEVAEVLYLAGMASGMQDKCGEAKALLERAISIRERTCGRDSPDAIRVREGLKLILARVGNKESAHA